MKIIPICITNIWCTVVFVALFSLTSATLRIGAFNIKVFGPSKASNPVIMDTLSKIIRRYDIILIQEIRDAKGRSIKTLLEKVNRDSGTWSYGMVISERAGRSPSKEQYAFFYKNGSTDGIDILSSYTYDDGDESLGNDHFEREPFLVKFYVKQAVVKTFALGAIHVKPEEAVPEITKLEDVFEDAKLRFNTNNIIVLGDLNADCSYVPKKAWPTIPIRNSPNFHWLIGDDVDTTVKVTTDCAYDRFIVTGEDFYNAVISGSVKTFRFDEEYNFSETEALKVSDHYPIELEIKTEVSAADRPFVMWILAILGIIAALYFNQREN